VLQRDAVCCSVLHCSTVRYSGCSCAGFIVSQGVFHFRMDTRERSRAPARETEQERERETEHEGERERESARERKRARAKERVHKKRRKGKRERAREDKITKCKYYFVFARADFQRIYRRRERLLLKNSSRSLLFCATK